MTHIKDILHQSREIDRILNSKDYDDDGRRVDSPFSTNPELSDRINFKERQARYISSLTPEEIKRITE